MTSRIYFSEAATRDGFQIEPEFVATGTKVALMNALRECGYARIEFTSFTSPKAIPMLRDADEVMGRIKWLIAASEAGRTSPTEVCDCY
jgi:hydroxymethylglutaryl-CoA lyase